jgi:hypothetical protein
VVSRSRRPRRPRRSRRPRRPRRLCQVRGVFAEKSDWLAERTALKAEGAGRAEKSSIRLVSPGGSRSGRFGGGFTSLRSQSPADLERIERRRRRR